MRSSSSTRSCQAGRHRAAFRKNLFWLDCRDLAEYLVRGPRVDCRGLLWSRGQYNPRISTRKSVFTCHKRSQSPELASHCTLEPLKGSVLPPQGADQQKLFRVPTENQSGLRLPGPIPFYSHYRPQLNSTSLFTKSASVNTIG